MHRLHSWYSRLRGLFTRGRLERDLHDEVTFHLDMLAADRAGTGVPEPQARAGARREFGNVAVLQEEMRDGWSVTMLEHLWRDIRHASRALRRAPGFSVVAVAALALGIGANTAILSVVDAVLLRPLPYAQPERLVMLWEDASRNGFPRNTPAPGNYASWRDLTHSFVDVAATRGALANLTADGAPEQLQGRRVTANFFRALDVAPVVGRVFTDDEDRRDAPVTVISYRLWQRRYAGNPNIVGTNILMNGQSRTVVGIMPASFMFRSREMDFWSPIAFTAADEQVRNSHILNVVARLAPGVALAQANADLRAVAARLTREFPATNAEVGAEAVPLSEDLLGDTDLQLMVLLGGAGCVLLIACANVASLLLSRALSRRGELAIRVSLGATTRAIVRQLMVEAMLLSIAGGVVGVILAPLGVAVLTGLVPPSMPEVVHPGIDFRLLALGLSLATVTGVLFSLVPALHAARTAAGEALHQAGRSGVGARSRWSRDLLVIAQVAAAVTLLVGAGLLLRTFDNLRRLELGFHADQLVTMRTPLPSPKYADGLRRLAFYERVANDVRQLPGVVSAAYVSTLPFGSAGNTISYDIDGRPAEGFRDALYRVSTNRYLETIGAQLVEGRLIDDRDGPDAPLAVVINDTFAALHFGGQSPLGNRIRFGRATAPWRTIVGVIRDVRERGHAFSAKPGAYVPYSQVLDGWYPENLVVRTSSDAAALVSSIRRVVATVDPEQPVAGVRSLQDLIDLDVVDRRQQTTLLSVFAGLALLLAALGLYGVLSHVVNQRRREIAVRVALGATVATVIGSVAGRGQRLVIAGLCVGFACAWVASRAMQTLLYGVDTSDLTTFASAGAVLWVVSLLASGVPALRAARVDPAIVLRDE